MFRVGHLQQAVIRAHRPFGVTGLDVSLFRALGQTDKAASELIATEGDELLGDGFHIHRFVLQSHFPCPYPHVSPQCFQRLFVLGEGDEIISEVDESDALAVLVFRLTDYHRHIHVGYQMTERVTDGKSLLVE